jgi:beta-glucosidase
MALTAQTLAIESKLPFQDPGVGAEERIDDLLSRLTLKEKIECLGTDPSVPRLGIRASGHVEGLHGLSQGGPANWTPPREVPTTIFPQSYGLGATWDPELIQRVAHVEGFEARFIFQNPNYRQGGIVIRAPNADLARDPRWGRTEESFGEDAFLTGTLTVAFVKGLQGDHPKYWMSASLMKHFLANSHENDRESTSSVFDERLWREYYSVPFRMGVEEGGSRAYMAAYNGWNGIPCHIHPMLKEITVKEWGQDGIICTDGGGLRLLHTDHKAFSTLEECAAAVIKAGIGQFLDKFKEPVLTALEKGLLSEADINLVLRGTFRVMFRLGLLDPPEIVPYSTIGEGPEPWATQDHKELAKLATLKSIVLLKNDGLLPLSKDLKRVAIIGSCADEVFIDWYSGKPGYATTPIEGIRAKLPGAKIVTSLNEVSDADVAIVVVGNHPTGNDDWARVEKKSYGKEAVDRESIDLEEEELIKQVYTLNKNTVVVLMSSFPYAINWTEDHVPAIFHLTHNCQETGSALAHVLFGDYNPAGRLTQTWPRSIDQLPPMMDYDLRHGRTYMYFKGEPLYPFGYGLSYTTFEYSNLGVTGELVHVDVTNSGSRDGEEVVQLYVSYPDSKVDRPNLQLRAFKRVLIHAGETQTVSLELRKRDLAYWNVERHEWTLEPGRIEVLVGGSSRDIRLNGVFRIP